MNKNDGGPAFPAKEYLYGENYRYPTGMSLRDWFAGMALQPIIASLTSPVPTEKVSEKAYEIADAMLKEREK